MAIQPFIFPRAECSKLLLICLCGALLLTSACGGDSSGDSGSSESSSSESSSSASTNLGPVGFELEVEAAGIKTLAFNWPEITGATHYKLLKKPNDASGFTQIGANLAETSATEQISVHLHDWQNARYQVKACDVAGCITSKTIDTLPALLDSIGYLKSSEPGDLHVFGQALALSDDGTTLVVGAPGAANNLGALYFYSRQADGWVLDQTVEGHDLIEFDFTERLGSVVALSGNGNRLAAGGIRPRVHVFTRTPDGWVQDSILYPDFFMNGESSFGSGLSFSHDGMTLAIGDFRDSYPATGIHGNYYDGEEDSFRSGAAYIYEHNGIFWVTWTYIKPPVIGRNYFFGRNLSLSSDGNTLAVGSYGEASATTSIDGDMNDASAPEAGAVFVYARKNYGWTEQAYIKAFNAEAGDRFGASLKLSANGNTLAVGAPREASDGSDPRDNSAPFTGAAYIYTRQGDDWNHQAYLKPANGSAAFGWSLSLTSDGTTLAVGAPGDNNPGAGINPVPSEQSMLDAGAVFLFKRADNTWSQRYIKSPNPDARDAFGHSVSLSADGSSLAVGASREQSNATGINGDREDNSLNQAGAAYLY